MSYKKMLVIILVVILTMFGLMLTTSYAWYSFEAGSTTFDAVTNNDDVEITFLKGEYINNTVGVPIASEDVDKYSDKHQFTVKTKNNKEDNEILVTVSLIEGSMSSSLRVNEFVVDLYHQGTLVASFDGSDFDFVNGGSTTKELASVILDNHLDNQFELRFYLLDNGEDQTSLMGKSFQAKIQVDVVSRLKTTVKDWNAPDIYVSSIMIDGTSSDSLPTDGYYDMTYSCTKESTLSWDGIGKTIHYVGGSSVNDSCSLSFTSGISTMLLNKVEPGSYVEYMGTNGCSGKHCQGDNANYESDLKMGYCQSSDYQFTVNGWRVGYVMGESAYLISAGAPECVVTYVENKNSSKTSQTLSTSYYYGSGYRFDSSTGKYTLTGVTDSTLVWSSNYQSIIANTPYTCLGTSSTGTCDTLVQVVEYSSSSAANVYLYYNYDGNGATSHIAHLNQVARTYCNNKYAYNGNCNENTAWAMNVKDFEYIVGNSLVSTCSSVYGNKSCGYGNDLIDNGSYYWYATADSSSGRDVYHWYAGDRYVDFSSSSADISGVRPVIKLDPSIQVVGGSGTYEDPYEISY